MGSLAIAGIKDCSQLRLLTSMTPQDELPLSSQDPHAQALVSLQLGPSPQVTSVHCEASEGLMKRCVGRERVDLCNHEEAQGLHSENELG